ncbi:type III-A CRISPR-associated protein Cas10/Csm1 [bacterium]|nr:type III-A CRISPR-associated protein Cas10/Csm1 [bacterium]
MNSLSPEEERLALTLASLLHDIGKLVQRANDEPSAKKHEEWGADWLSATNFHPSLLPPNLKNYVERLIYNHHSSSPYPALEKTLSLLRQADQLSAQERLEKEDISAGEQGKWERKTPLRSILSEIHLQDKQSPNPSYWSVQPLTPSFLYPKTNKEAASAETSQYKLILNKLNSRIPTITSIPSLLSLLEELLTFIPSETIIVLSQDEINPENEPDISLYDHLKLTCALALSLYDSQDNGFLYLRGDLSGVQKFIYTITSKGALKSLRARSLYIELLSHHIAALLLEQFNLPPSNLIFCGGAQFEILLPNKPDAENLLSKLRNSLNKWLWDMFAGRLYLALQWVPLSPQDLNSQPLLQKRKELFSRLEMDKNRKFFNLKEELFKPIEVNKGKCEACEGTFYECDVCKAPSEIYKEIEEGVHLCPLCYTLFQLGGAIPKIKEPCFVAHPQGDIPLPDARYKLIDRRELNSYLSRADRIFLINAKPDNLPFHPHTYFLTLARYASKDENGDVRDFDGFAQAGIGASRIGVLRLDVDHLGMIFGAGIPENRYSFSRVATLSRFLTIFFKSYIDDILKGKEVAVVYSGGDDAFIVGAWNDVLESAFEIQEKFSSFTQNPSFTISAGYLVCDPKEPLYQIAKMSGDMEESAKDSGRNRFSFFQKRENEPLWEDCFKIKGWKEEFLRDFAELKDGHYELVLPRSFLYRLLEISRSWEKEKSIYPYIYLVYIVGRIRESFKKNDLEDKWHKFTVSTLLEAENMPFFPYLVYWIDLLIREKGGAS